MAPNPDSDQHKRKRDISDDNGSQAPHADRIPQPPPPQSAPINYLSKAHSVKLKLIQGDSDTFSDVLTLVNEYEGVLNRHESLASNLGAKLTGSRLLKAMEGAFEGSITTTPPQTIFSPDPVTWLDIVEFAKAKPGEFVLTPSPNGGRCCQFPLKGIQVEIGEDDWRLIVSGALDRFRLVPPQPLEEDETAELATLEIVEQRLQVLIKKADEVARRARQLNYHLSGRKASIHARRASQSASGSTFQAVNQSMGSGANPGYDLHADLLQQFLAPSQPSSHRISSVGSIPPTPNPMAATTTSTPRTSIQQQQQALIGSNRPSPSYPTEPAMRDAEEENRALVTAKIERLARGDIIHPPCDRCRRLKTQCIKHLTACQGCTKKHARCVWKYLTEEEVAWLKGEAGGDGDDDGDEPRDPSRAIFGPQSHVEFGERRRESEHGEEPSTSRSGSRIAIGRPADDVWRKGPETQISRHETMEVDVRDARQGQEYQRKEAGSGMFREPKSMLSHMASVASAAADAAVISRGSHPHSE
ncbi:uncharacterized protein F4812DRAFT_8927 [Daldinia caldariorum]|uniref:uncharacterized protein n=1 Tax=Daldinia caldariorum TaxID=326644 RepID=UPI0020077962|nr:uncharacterized protein F4812DRAFT_8927 [Daldinia caldariorum]KAI1472325.1 hypothetical protein F4812DRAFT_8927 [Daldinia caldariorum]